MGSYSGDPNLVDGDINTSLNFRRGASALLQSTETDLGRLVPINSVRVLTEPPSRGSFEDVSLKGYSIFLSKDGVDFTEVGSANNIVNFQEARQRLLHRNSSSTSPRRANGKRKAEVLEETAAKAGSAVKGNRESSRGKHIGHPCF